MATPPRIFEAGSYYHVYNRGNRKQQIFLRAKDYERFLNKTIEYKKKYSLEILSYCLMPNHFHFLLRQVSENGISRFISDLSNSYSRYFNIKYDTVGSLFKGRFKAKIVDKDEYLVHLSRYIHLNPSEFFHSLDKNIGMLLSYQWSSLPSYFSEKNDDIVNTKPILSYFSSKDQREDYKDFVGSQVKTNIDPVIDHLVFEE